MRDWKCIFYFIVRFSTARLEVLFRRLLPCVCPWRVMSFFFVLYFKYNIACILGATVVYSIVLIVQLVVSCAAYFEFICSHLSMIFW